MKTTSFNALAMLLFFLVAWSSATASVKETQDIPYLGKGRKEKLDAYLPILSDGQLAPAVVYIHGGGWAIGDKASGKERAIPIALSKEGYAVFSINYHLTRFAGKKWKSEIKTPGWPQNIYDCKSAVRYVRKNAAKYKIDPNRIAVMGSSAGGHLALLTALSYENQKLNDGALYTDVSCRVKCVISLCGIPDIRIWGGDAFMGSDPKANAQEWALASPVTHLSEKSPPIMLIHGDKDLTVDVSLSTKFAEMLTQKKHPHKLIIVKNAGHNLQLKSKANDLTPNVVKFLDKYTK
jgi:acetyl esterase/lipase